MALIITCDICKDELDEPGALLITPPVGHTVFKHHICKKCVTPILQLFMIQATAAEKFKAIKTALLPTEEIK